jgi:hypothetical protein
MKTIRYLNARQRDEPLFAITLARIKGREAIFEKNFSGARHIKTPLDKSKAALLFNTRGVHDILSQ